MKNLRTKPRSSVLLAVMALLATPLLQAQTAATPPAPATTAAPEEEEVLVLSAFVVNAETDTGYVATSTLAGTRLRTELRDVAASISVITKDFMQDIGANNLETLLTYTTSTEVEGLSGNISGSGYNSTGFQEFNGASRRVQGETRVRGLGAADQTRDFFLTDTAMDSYNIDRVEVNRGPNAILFGLGRPAGIVNSSLLKAQTNRTKTKVEGQFDQEASRRLVLDHNQVLIKDVLALRFAALDADKRFQIKPAYIRDKRYFLTGTYRPWKGANLRLNAEHAKQQSARPYTSTPMDSYTWWFALGKPVYNPTTGLGSYLGTPSDNPNLRPFNPVTGAGTSSVSSTNRPGSLTGGLANNTSLVLVAQEPNSSQLGITGLGSDILAMEFGNTRARLNTNGSYAGNEGMRKLGSGQDYLRQLNTDKPLLFNAWKDQRLMDPAVFDFYHQMLEGPNKREWANWNTRNATFSQEFGRSAGMEIAYDKQRIASGYVQPYQNRQNSITIDINTHLMDGTPNDNLGRPMSQTATGFKNSNSVEREAMRASAYYQLDFIKLKQRWLAKLLGRHIFTGNYTVQDRESYSFGGRLEQMGNDYQQAKLINSPLDRPGGAIPPVGNPNQVFNIGTSERTLTRVSYHGPSLKNEASLDGYTFQGLTARQDIDGATSLTVRYYERPANVTTPLPRPLGAWKTGTFSVLPEDSYDFKSVTTGGDHKYEKTVSTAFVANSYWWDETLVSTLALRKDNYKSYVAESPLFGEDGVKVTDSAVWKLPEVPFSMSETRFNYGFVLHTPPSLRGKLPLGADVSFFYNKSDNFQPTAQRYDIYDRAIGPTSGKTEEWSVLLGLFNKKLQLRAIKYKTTAADATVSFGEIQNRLYRRLETQCELVRNTTYRADMVAKGFGADLDAWDAWEQSPAAQAMFKTFRFQFPDSPPTGSTPNIVTQDRIGEVVGVQDVVAQGYEYELTYNPTSQWRITLNAAEQVTINDNTGLQFRKMMNEISPVWGGTAGQLQTGLTTSDNLGSDFATTDILLRTQERQDGGPTPELRRWRFNAITNYTFKGGRLKGVRIGGAYRWQDRAAIGFPVIYAPDGISAIPDVKHPYYGETEGNFDAWIGYSHKISKKITWNIQLNVKNIGVGDRLIAVSTQPDGTVDSARIATAQSWALTNSFEF